MEAFPSIHKCLYFPWEMGSFWRKLWQWNYYFTETEERAVSCNLHLVADKLRFLNRGTCSIMYQELACISNALYARSHLSHSGPSAPGLPLFCQSVEQLKRDLPTTLAGMTGSDSLVYEKSGLREKCRFVCVWGCSGALDCEAGKQSRKETERDGHICTYRLVFTVSSYRV